METKQMKDLILNLDTQNGNVLSRLENLKTLADEVNSVRQEADDIHAEGDLQKTVVHSNKLYRKIKLFDDLLYYIVYGLDEDYSKLEDIHEEMHTLIHQESE